MSAFAGCFDKVLGVEFEDCYIETANAEQNKPVFDWLADTLAGRDLTHDLAVTEYNSSGNATRTVEIRDGFIKELSISDLDASNGATGRYSLVVVPEDLRVTAGGPAPSSFPSLKLWQRNNFALSVAGTTETGVAKIQDIAVEVPKVDGGVFGGRKRFQPGTPAVRDLTVALAGTSAGALATQARFEDWVADVLKGLDARRDGSITVRESGGATIFTVDLAGLRPITALDPFADAAGQRSISLAGDRLEIEAAP
jgi:hypothetical protein